MNLADLFAPPSDDGGLAQLLMLAAVRGDKPGYKQGIPQNAPQGAIPPDWWQGGGPKAPPQPPMDLLPVPPTGAPLPYSMGSPPPDMGLEGRRRMRPEPSDMFAAPGVEDLMKKFLDMQAPMLPGTERERIAPRLYGRGQLI